MAVMRVRAGPRQTQGYIVIGTDTQLSSYRSVYVYFGLFGNCIGAATSVLETGEFQPMRDCNKGSCFNGKLLSYVFACLLDSLASTGIPRQQVREVSFGICAANQSEAIL